MFDWVKLKAELQVWRLLQSAKREVMRAVVGAGAGEMREGPDEGTSRRRKLWDLGSGGGSRFEVIKDRNESAMFSQGLLLG